MLTVHCSARNHYVDLTPANIECLDLRGARLLVRWRCRCGHRDVVITRAATQSLTVDDEPREAA